MGDDRIEGDAGIDRESKLSTAHRALRADFAKPWAAMASASPIPGKYIPVDQARTPRPPKVKPGLLEFIT